MDRRNQALGRGPDERQLNAITRIVIHHSGNPTNGNHLNTALFENGWRNNPAMGAPHARGGYHEVVLFNGNVEINMQDRRMVWGARDQNGHTWHICVTGQHVGHTSNITQHQLDVLAQRIAEAMRRFGWTANQVDRIVRHCDLPGQATSCNNININNIRAAVRDILNDNRPSAPAQTPQPTQPANNNADTFVVATQTGGFMTAADARANRNQRTTVQPGTYHVFNRATGMINVTRTPGTPGSWINPAGQNAPSPQTPAIRVGTRVRVNLNARTWATGETIPRFVQGQTYTVKQIRHNGNELLLSQVISWVRRQDVTVF
ncbi:MAG: N-acetylmuramoyl-L-alanine amidase [Defluviitaleaceae bacterium]|nr:N-acetylmuramoyl-L-alanine amidase [Defluviitaleaceae bacterium]